MNEIAREIAEIRRILSSARLIDVVRKEVRRAMCGQRAMVLGGEVSDNPNYDVIIMHDSGKQGNGLITRRLKKAVDDIEITELNSMVKSVLGIRYARRGRKHGVPKAEQSS